MTLRDRIMLKASPIVVWELLADPASMARWNPKCVRCDIGFSRVQVGLRYKAVFRLSGPERETDCEVIACEPCKLLVTRFLLDFSGRAGYVDETFRLEPLSDGTRIVHEVNFAHSGLPLWLRLFMKLMDRVGAKAGESSLDGIRNLVEQAKA